ncbi:carbohydrate sulfotransferase 11-like [Amphiura filiformis]|uniref:carbohydrate sulfotransferase 11-like n=1 Tax=Amphiura filiformis TaxID=82378 RepID=UPI003B22626E
MNLYRQSKYANHLSAADDRNNVGSRFSTKRLLRQRNFRICAVTALIIMLMLPGNIYLLTTIYIRKPVQYNLDLNHMGYHEQPVPTIPVHVDNKLSKTQQWVQKQPHQWAQKQGHLRHNLQHQCSSLGLGNRITPAWVTKNKKKLKHILVSDKHKALYCFVPKVACTNWKEVFLVMNGMAKQKNVQQLTPKAVHIKVDNAKWSLAKMSTPNVLHRLSTYKSFLFVRNPFTRVLSAYRDKLDYGTTGWVRQMFAKTIKTKYGKHTNLNKRQHYAPKDGYNVTFKEFVQFLGDPSHSMTNFAEDHWMPILDICYPCSVQYDFIGKFETLQTDAENILEQIGASHLADLVLGQVHHPTNSSEQSQMKAYFQQLTKTDIDGLLWRYEKDLKLFDYDEEIPIY